MTSSPTDDPAEPDATTSATTLAATEPTDPSAAPGEQVPALRWGMGMTATAAVMVLVVMAEIDRLAAAALDSKGRSWPFAGLMGPGTLLDRSPDGWVADSGTFSAETLTSWLQVYLAADLVFIGCYTALLVTALWVQHPVAARLVVALAGVDLLENALALAAGRQAAVVAPGLVERALPWVTAAKFGLVLAIVVLVVTRFAGSEGGPWRASAGRRVRALRFHRFSVLALLPLAVLSAIPGPNILDQLPDVQRRWADDPGGEGWRHAGVALASILLLAGVLFVLGRLRSSFAWRVAHPPDDAEVTPPLLKMWLVGPAALAVLLLLDVGWQVPGVLLERTAIFAGVPLLIWAASHLVRRLSSWPTQPGRTLAAEAVPVIVRTGDTLAVAAVALAGLGLVRSFTAVVLAGAGDGAGGWPVGAAVGAGMALGIGVWPLAGRILSRFDAGIVPAGPPSSSRVGARALQIVPEPPRLPTWVPTVLLGASFAGFLAMGLFPVRFAEWAGVAAATVLTVTSLTVMVGSIVVIAQEGGAPQIFWPLRIPAAPVATLLLLTVALASMRIGDGAVHRVRGGDGDATAVQERPGLDTAFADWVAEPEPCRHTVQVGEVEIRLRPLLLMAAEGGGIRAAYWTALGVDEIARTGPEECGARATLLSSGASGGAVGLVAGRFAEPAAAAGHIEELADPTALGAGVVGLMVRDLTYSATGIPLPVLGSPHVVDRLRVGEATGRPWADRAGLIEAVWEGTGPYAGPFLPAAEEGDGDVPTGQLVLVSTSVATGCRVFVSQLTLSGRSSSDPTTTDPPAEEDDADDVPANAACDQLDRPAPNTIDLLGDYAPQDDADADAETDDDGERCLGELRASTAAMLASRFPYVTPSGVVGPCGDWPLQQLVDGGYVETTGIGTLVDLAHEWMGLVRERNTTALRAPDGSGPVEVIVPVVLFFDNGTGSDLTAPARRATSELLVPPLTDGRAQKAHSSNTALLQRAGDVVDVEELWDEAALEQDASAGETEPDRVEVDLDELAAQVDTWRPRPVVVVHQGTEPAITAPLGWVLSGESAATLESALGHQARTGCAEQKLNAMCARGFGSLHDALGLLTRD